MFTEEIKELKKVFDLEALERDCRFLRKEEAGVGEHEVKITKLCLDKTSYGKDYFKLEMRCLQNQKVISKIWFLNDLGLPQAIQFLYSLNLVKSVTYDTFYDSLHDIEKIASLFIWKVVYNGTDVFVLDKKIGGSVC